MSGEQETIKNSWWKLTNSICRTSTMIKIMCNSIGKCEEDMNPLIETMNVYVVIILYDRVPNGNMVTGKGEEPHVMLKNTPPQIIL